MNNFVKLTLGALCIIGLYLWYTRDKLDLTIFTEDFPLTYVKVENGQKITVESGYNKSFCFLGDFDIAKINNLARKNPSFNLSIQRAFSESSIFNRQIPSKSKQLYEVFAPSGMKDGLYFVFLCDSSKANLGLCNPKELKTEDFDVLASSAFSKKNRTKSWHDTRYLYSASYFLKIGDYFIGPKKTASNNAVMSSFMKVIKSLRSPIELTKEEFQFMTRVRRKLGPISVLDNDLVPLKETTPKEKDLADQKVGLRIFLPQTNQKMCSYKIFANKYRREK